MAKITVTNPLSSLRAVFNKMDEVYYLSKELTVTALGSAITPDLELPVLSDGVTFNSQVDDRRKLGGTHRERRFGHLASGGQLEG